LKVNTEKIEYMFLSRKYSVGQNCKTNIPNKRFEYEVKFKYFGGLLTNQNCIVKKLRAECTHGMPATIRPTIFSLPFSLYENDKIIYTDR